MGCVPIPPPGCGGKYKTTVKDWLVAAAIVAPILGFVVAISYGLAFYILAPLAGLPM